MNLCALAMAGTPPTTPPLALILAIIAIVVIFLSVAFRRKPTQTFIGYGDRVKAQRLLNVVVFPESAFDPTVEGIVMSASRDELSIRTDDGTLFTCYREGAIVLKRRSE